ncbi:MAG: transcriptional regulator, MarR family [Modestobacter sp.]|nr:transcriptional regulator, MarR family [Modestobacter sp.]
MTPRVSSSPAPADPTPGTATRWLDPAEQGAWRAWMYSSQLLHAQLDRELIRETGISMTYYEILVQLSEAPERRMRMSQLADECLSSRSRLSHAVARLEERGWIQRQTCPEGGRGQLAVLTDEGYAALESAAPVHVASVRAHLFDQLSPAQVEAMRDVGETLLRHLDAR